MGYTKILKDGREVEVPYWHDYCEKHNHIFMLRHGCDDCKKETLEK